MQGTNLGERHPKISRKIDYQASMYLFSQDLSCYLNMLIYSLQQHYIERPPKEILVSFAQQVEGLLAIMLLYSVLHIMKVNMGNVSLTRMPTLQLLVQIVQYYNTQGKCVTSRLIEMTMSPSPMFQLSMPQQLGNHHIRDRLIFSCFMNPYGWVTRWTTH